LDFTANCLGNWKSYPPTSFRIRNWIALSVHLSPWYNIVSTYKLTEINININIEVSRIVNWNDKINTKSWFLGRSCALEMYISSEDIRRVRNFMTSSVTPLRELNVTATLLLRRLSSGTGINFRVFVLWIRESSSSIMITRNPNWSFRDFKVRDWLCKGNVLAPLVHPT
jgi:hypothetical protein